MSEKESIIPLSEEAKAPMTTEEAEASLLEEMMGRCKIYKAEARDSSPALPGEDLLSNAPSTIEEMRLRLKRAEALSGSAILRVARQFLNETDPKLN